MTAIRSVGSAEGKFVQISNALIRDEEMSVLARFIVCYVLSLPPDHHFTAEWLEGRLPGYGTRSVRAALGELKARGYMKVTRRSRGRGIWEWEQVISDGPLDDFSGEQLRTDETTCGNSSAQVVSSVQVSPDDGSSDDGRSDKELNTEQPQHEDQKMVDRRASRRAQASGSRAKRGRSQIIADVRQAVAEVHGDSEAFDLTDGQALGLYFTYANPDKGPVRDLAAYMAKILGDAPYLDTLLANAGAVCIPCNHWESDCQCGKASAA